MRPNTGKLIEYLGLKLWGAAVDGVDRRSLERRKLLFYHSDVCVPGLGSLPIYRMSRESCGRHGRVRKRYIYAYMLLGLGCIGNLWKERCHLWVANGTNFVPSLSVGLFGEIEIVRSPSE